MIKLQGFVTICFCLGEVVVKHVMGGKKIIKFKVAWIPFHSLFQHVFGPKGIPLDEIRNHVKLA